MEIVNTLDIDGTQWQIQDTQARQDITGLKTEFKTSYTVSIPLTLKPGITAAQAEVRNIQKMGKLVFCNITLKNLDGESFTANANTDIAAFPFAVLGYFEFLLYDTSNKKTLRCRIKDNNTLNIITDRDFVTGFSFITGQLAFIEK